MVNSEQLPIAADPPSAHTGCPTGATIFPDSVASEVSALLSLCSGEQLLQFEAPFIRSALEQYRKSFRQAQRFVEIKLVPSVKKIRLASATDADGVAAQVVALKKQVRGL